MNTPNPFKRDVALKSTTPYSSESYLLTKKLNTWAPLLACVIFLLLSPGCNNKIEQRREENAFHAFIKCDSTPEQDAILSQLRTKAKPIEKRYGLWIYAYKSKVLGVDSDKIILGVCGEDGNVDCGWSTFLAFQLNQSVSSTKSVLLKYHGEDFAIEHRSENSEITLRPLLAKDEKSNETWLLCDSGVL